MIKTALWQITDTEVCPVGWWGNALQLENISVCVPELHVGCWLPVIGNLWCYASVSWLKSKHPPDIWIRQWNGLWIWLHPDKIPRTYIPSEVPPWDWDWGLPSWVLENGLNDIYLHKYRQIRDMEDNDLHLSFRRRLCGPAHNAGGVHIVLFQCQMKHTGFQPPRSLHWTKCCQNLLVTLGRPLFSSLLWRQRVERRSVSFVREVDCKRILNIKHKILLRKGAHGKAELKLVVHSAFY